MVKDLKENSLQDTLKIMGKLLSQIKSNSELNDVDVSVRFSAEVYDSDDESYEYSISLVIDIQPIINPIDYKVIETIKKISEDMGFLISKIDSTDNSIILYLYYELGKDSI
ncbi:MAG: hypothetical protein OWQ54_08355 [Sulfolobaceae archaeon]|nr:hypothetical protein [Sulfolobaceae archaeon]